MDLVFDENFITSPNMMDCAGKIDSPIKDFYKDKVVFLTGGTGFIGKLMIEKMLRIHVKTIYILARPKKGKSPSDRVAELFSEPIFSKMSADNKKRVIIVEGDLSLLNCGMTEEMRQEIIDNVQIVFHAAADVRFDESLKESIETNVRGTRDIITLTHQIKNLIVFIYMSTAFTNCNRPIVEEKFYRTMIDPDFMIKLVESIPEAECDEFQVMAKRIIQPYPNTYTYTKALAEQIVRKYANNLPIAIIRPSIVTTTFRDPIAGWCDNVYGLNGVVTGAGVGVLRILHIDNKKRADIVPADTVVNSTLALAWYTVRNLNNNEIIAPKIKEEEKVEEFYYNYEEEKIQIYNCVVGNENAVTWGDVKERAINTGKAYPIEKALWIVTYNTTPYYYVSQFLKIWYHFLPALLVDEYCKLTGRKPKLLKLYRKVNKFSEVLAFFTNNEWTFMNGNMQKMFRELTAYDKKYFNFDLDSMSWDEFFEVYVQGLRLYIAKESKDTLPDAIKRRTKLSIIHYSFMSVVYMAMSYSAYNIMNYYGIIDSGIGFYNGILDALKSLFIQSSA